MEAVGITYVLVLLYSPISPYFAGTQIEAKKDQMTCAAEAPHRIGEELNTGGIGWEKEMMGQKPKVVAAYCAQGAVAH
jgi:hypothetical protein